MNEVDVEHRITEVEQRAKSNSHRLDKLEPFHPVLLAESCTDLTDRLLAARV